MDDWITAYFAGLFDGEGTVFIYHRKSYPYIGCKTKPFIIMVKLSNTNNTVLQMLKSKFGGHIYKHKKPQNRKQAWTWQCSNQIATRFLRAVLGYLVIKKPEAILGIKMQEAIDEYKRSGMNGGKIMPQAETEKRMAIHREFLELRKAG